MIYSEGFDPADIAYLETWAGLRDHAAMVETMTVVVSYVTPSGDSGWRHYTTSGATVSQIVGLLEMAKLGVLGDTECGMRFGASVEGD